MKPILLTANELAARYGVHVKTIYDWTYSKRLPVIKLSRTCVRFNAEKCDRALKWKPAAEPVTQTGALPPGRKLATAKEIALRYAVHMKTIYKWTYRGILPVVKIGRNCARYDVEKCDQALERRTRVARSTTP